LIVFHRRFVAPALLLLTVAASVYLQRSRIRERLHLATIDEVRRRLVYRPRASPELLRSGRVMIALITGQSNAGNYASASRPEEHRRVFELFGDRVFEARNPLLGSDGVRSTPWIELGRKLIASGRYDSVAFALAVRGGTMVREWLPKGSMEALVFARISDLERLHLRPTLVLWQQGEWDARYLATSEKLAYAQSLRSFLNSLRARGVRAPVFVATATRTAANAPDVLIREQQHLVVNPEASVYPGPDTDLLGPEYRRDGTHFNEAGLRRVTELWYETLTGATALLAHDIQPAR
jgi:hypothetical protein